VEETVPSPANCAKQRRYRMSSSSSARGSGMDMSIATLVMAFIAGALAVPIFHQIALWLLNTIGVVQMLFGIPALPIFNMAPTKPFGGGSMAAPR